MFKINPVLTIRVWLIYAFKTLVNNLFLKIFYKKLKKLSKFLFFFLFFFNIKNFIKNLFINTLKHLSGKPNSKTKWKYVTVKESFTLQSISKEFNTFVDN